jgi:hypothetical protein
MCNKEFLTNVFYLDQIAMKNSDPTNIKYFGRVRDHRGISMKDYYVENTMNSNNYAAPQYVIDDDAFKNQADFCPKPLSHFCIKN